MKKLFLGVLLAGTMMSFANVENHKINEDDAFQCVVRIYDEDGYQIAVGYRETCQEARAIALRQIQ